MQGAKGDWCRHDRPRWRCSPGGVGECSRPLPIPLLRALWTVVPLSAAGTPLACGARPTKPNVFAPRGSSGPVRLIQDPVARGRRAVPKSGARDSAPRVTSTGLNFREFHDGPHRRGGPDRRASPRRRRMTEAELRELGIQVTRLLEERGHVGRATSCGSDVLSPTITRTATPAGPPDGTPRRASGVAT